MTSRSKRPRERQEMRKAAWDIKFQMGGTAEDHEHIKGRVTVRSGECKTRDRSEKKGLM